MKANLDEDGGDFSIRSYLGEDGKHISNTLGCLAARLKHGAINVFPRDTCSYIVHVVSGQGESNIELPNGTIKTVKWAKSDTFCLPAWSRTTHIAESAEDAYVFMLTDKPLLDNLHMYISEKEDQN